ncbi:MAG: sigma-70 family RNA polymerase sigma factor [Myxococcales bacterium]|nr:sigma-70 family RNA polymerase sigma factor [Myxococcales bacterium]
MPDVTEPASDEALLDAARAGDSEALERLLERHQAQVYRFGMTMCRSPEDAKDVLQDTLIAVARGVRDFRGSSSLSTWLYTIARSFCIKKRRRSKFAPELERTADVSDLGAFATDPGAGPDELLVSKQVRLALEEAIGALAPAYREVLLLRDAEGLTAPEVAEVLGLSVAAVKTRLHRARAEVRAQVGPKLGITSLPPGPACPDVVALFSRFLEDEISPSTCTDMQRHLQGCARCSALCDSLKQTLALCRTSPAEAQVPAEVQASVKTALRDYLRVGR